MAITINHSVGRPTFNWLDIFYQVVNAGTFGASLDGGTTITMTSGALTVVFTGALLSNDTDPGDEHLLAGGTITGIAIFDGAQQVVDAAGFNNYDFSAFNGIITDTRASANNAFDFIYNVLDPSGLIEEDLLVNGSADGDDIYGSEFADTLNGGDGDDYFETRGTADGADGVPDIVDGGGGVDYMTVGQFEAVGVVVDWLQGQVRSNDINNELLIEFSNIEQVETTNLNDIVNATDEGDLIRTLDGQDLINAGGGDDYVQGGSGNDTINGGAGRDTLDLNLEGGAVATQGATVTLTVGGNGTATDAGGGNDTLTSIEDFIGTELGDTFNLDENDNRVEGRDGDDVINGGGGHDELRGEGGNDTINGGDGDDRIRGGDGDNTLYGEAGRDNINGGRGADTISAGSGEFDYIGGSSGADTVNGNEGFDMLSFEADLENLGDHVADGIQVTLNDAFIGSGTILGFYGLNLTDVPGGIVDTGFQNIERVVGTVGADTFTSIEGNFQNTDDADTSFFGVRGLGGVFGFTGGAGADTFNITNNLAIIDYDEEKWRHLGYNGDHQWGSQAGEDGVIVNMTAGGAVGTFGLIDYTLGANEARDTFGHIDIIVAANAFRLTDANDLFFAGNTDTYAEGRGGNDTMSGGTANDSFNGGDGDDSVFGNEGSDEFNGEEGDDFFYGGSGRDFGWGQNGNDTLNGEAGNDELRGDDGIDTLNGGTGNDNIDGGNDNDTINGDDGNDRLRGGGHDDEVYGDAGNDRVSGGWGSDNLFGGADADEVFGDSENDWVNGGLGSDQLWGDDGDDILSGDDDLAVNLDLGTLSPEDFDALTQGIEVLGGADRLWGGSGNDIMFGGKGSDELFGEDDDDNLFGGEGDDKVYGGNGNDTIGGNPGNDQLFGENGDDFISAGNGDDLVYGGANDDQIRGRGGADTLYGDAGNDIIYGEDLDGVIGTGDVIHGGDGDDAINGQDGSDWVFGDGDNDTLEGGDGADFLRGGSGNDFYIFRLTTNDIAEDHIFDEGGTDRINSEVSVNLTSTVKNLHLSNVENVTLLGTANNFATGNGGANALVGNSGINTLTGNGGIDSLNGGLGNDVFVFQFATNDQAQDTVNDSGGIDRVDSDGTISIATFATVENLTLTGLSAINGTGNGLANVITGNGAVNVLSGGNGNDTLIGLGGNDILNGDANNDSLNGGANNDRLTGGIGADTLTGGLNFDTFAFAAGNSGLLATTLDTVADYAKGAVGVGDEFDYAAVLTRGGNALAATATQASVSATTGVATFLAGNGLTLADALADINGRFTAAGNAAGEFAFFKVAGAGAYHLFISDGVAGLGANDVLVKVTNLTAITSINLTGGDLTILT